MSDDKNSGRASDKGQAKNLAEGNNVKAPPAYVEPDQVGHVDVVQHGNRGDRVIPGAGTSLMYEGATKRPWWQSPSSRSKKLHAANVQPLLDKPNASKGANPLKRLLLWGTPVAALAVYLGLSNFTKDENTPTDLSANQSHDRQIQDYTEQWKLAANSVVPYKIYGVSNDMFSVQNAAQPKQEKPEDPLSTVGSGGAQANVDFKNNYYNGSKAFAEANQKNKQQKNTVQVLAPAPKTDKTPQAHDKPSEPQKTISITALNQVKDSIQQLAGSEDDNAHVKLLQRSLNIFTAIENSENQTLADDGIAASKTRADFNARFQQILSQLKKEGLYKGSEVQLYGVRAQQAIKAKIAQLPQNAPKRVALEGMQTALDGIWTQQKKKNPQYTKFVGMFLPASDDANITYHGDIVQDVSSTQTLSMQERQALKDLKNQPVSVSDPSIFEDYILRSKGLERRVGKFIKADFEVSSANGQHSAQTLERAIKLMQETKALGPYIDHFNSLSEPTQPNARPCDDPQDIAVALSCENYETRQDLENYMHKTGIWQQIREL